MASRRRSWTWRALKRTWPRSRGDLPARWRLKPARGKPKPRKSCAHRSDARAVLGLAGAESLYSGQVVANPGTTDVAALARAAEGFYRAGQIDDALTAYDRAVAQSHAAGRDEQSFALGYAAAAIEH